MPRNLEDLTPPDCEMCQLLSGLGAMFDTAKLIKLEFSAKALKSYIGIVLISALSFFYLYLFIVANCMLQGVRFLRFVVYADMTLNTERKKKLADLLAKRRAAAAGVGTSTPTNPPSSATSSPNTSEPAPIDNREKGVVVIAGSEDEDTCTSLVFKKPRVGDVEVATHSASDGHALSFHENPPSASSPPDLVVHESGGESAPKDHQSPPAPDLLSLLQQALKHFQDKEMAESLGGNLLQYRVAQDLGDFLVASSLALSKAHEAQDLQAEIAKLKEELTLKTKAFSNQETAMYQELTSLRQSEKEVKKLLFEKSQEAIELDAKISPLHNKVVDMEEKVEGM